MKSYKGLTQRLDEILTKSTPAGKWIDDFVHSDNPKFAGKSPAKRKQMALAAYYAKQNESAAVSQNSTAEVDMREAKEDHLVHVNDGSKYDEQPHEKDVEHVMAGVKKHGGEHAGGSDKGVFFKFPSKEHAQNFMHHVNKCPHRSCDAHLTESMKEYEPDARQDSTGGIGATEAVEYKGIGTDVVDKKKKLNPQPNLMTAKKTVKDFKEGYEHGPIDRDAKVAVGHKAAVLAGSGLDSGKHGTVVGSSKERTGDMWHIKTASGDIVKMHKHRVAKLKEDLELITKHEVKADAPHKTSGHIILSKSSNKWHVLHNKKSNPSVKDLHNSKLLHSYDNEKEARAKFKELHEEQINEISKKTLGSYVKKAEKEEDKYQQNYSKLRSIRDTTHGKFSDDTPEMKHLDKKYVNRANGVHTAKQKLAKEDVELDEAKVYDPITKKMVPTKPIKVQAGGGATRNGVPVEGGPSKYKTIRQAYDAATAGQTVTPKQKLTKEEVVNLDEISKSTLMRYIPKAARDVGSHTYAGKEAGEHASQHTRAGDWEAAEKKSKKSYADFKKANKRIAGIDRATKKLGTQKEEVQNEAIAHPLPVKHASDAVAKTLGTQAATRFLGHLKPGEDKHTTWDKVNAALMKQGVQTHHIAKIAQHTSHMNEAKLIPGTPVHTRASQVKSTTHQQKMNNESRGHKVLNTFFKNREVAQRAFTGDSTPADKGIETPKKDAEQKKKMMGIKEGFLTPSIEADMKNLSAYEYLKKYGKHKSAHRQALRTKSSDIERVQEGFDDYKAIAKELIKRHGKNIDSGHINDLASERDSHRGLDHAEVMYHVKKELKEANMPTDEKWTDYMGKSLTHAHELHKQHAAADHPEEKADIKDKISKHNQRIIDAAKKLKREGY